MEAKKGYVVLQVGYEYNDEYYHSGDYGEMYDAPDKVYISKEKAEEVLKAKTMEKLKGEDLGRYNGNGLEGICKTNKIGQFTKVMMEEFELDAEDWDLEIPKNATDEQLEKVMECLKLNFYELVEVELE